MRKSSLGKLLTVILWGVMLATSPVSFAVDLCTSGRAPDCCPEGVGGEPAAPHGDVEMRGAACVCCVTVDGLPFDIASRTVASPVAAKLPVSYAVPAAPPKTFVEAFDRFGGYDSRLPSHRSPILLI